MTLAPGVTFRHVRACDRYRPLYYAAASGDLNPIHVDAEVARAAGLPGPILQGMCTYGWLAEACTAAAGDPGALVALAAGFSRPVAPGDTVAFDVRCAAVEGGIARLEIAAANERGEPVLRDARAHVRLAPGGEAPASPAPGAARPAGARAYGPYAYEAGLEKIRDFALALSGGVPTRLVAIGGDPPPHPWHVDEDAARASPHGAVIAPATFAAVYAMQPFAAAITDPANGIDLLRALHGEQELRLHRAVRAGDRLVTEGWIAARAPRGSAEILAVASRTVDAGGALVAEALWTALIR